MALLEIGSGGNILDSGSIGNYHDAMTGQTGENAALMAAYLQSQGIIKATDYITDRGDELAAAYDPRIDMGEAAFQEYAAGRTPEGFASNLEAMFTPSPKTSSS